MSSVLSPRQSGEFIAKSSQDVTIQMKGVSRCAKHVYDRLKATGYGVQSWKENELHPKTMDKAAVDWFSQLAIQDAYNLPLCWLFYSAGSQSGVCCQEALETLHQLTMQNLMYADLVFVADSLNFCFWSHDPKKTFCVEYEGEKWSGYWSLCAALNRALEQGVPITDPHFYASITQDQLAEVFHSETSMEAPLLPERLKILHEVGQVLIEKYDGSFMNCIRQCNGSAMDLLQLIVTDFPAFRDEADYNGKRVSFYKRAQILIADVWGCCEGKGVGEFHDIGELTMFADYRVPQVLVYFGAMKYSDFLMDFLSTGQCMENGDRLEIEIRGCTIWTTELVCQEMKKIMENDEDKNSSRLQINSVIIDEFLWDYRRSNADDIDKIPYHKVRTIFY